MVNRIVIVTDETQIAQLFDALETANEEFQIVTLFWIGNMTRTEYNGYEIVSIEQICDLYHMEYDLIINVNALETAVFALLKEVCPRDKIISYNEFVQRFLDEEMIMQCLQKKIQRICTNQGNDKPYVSIGEFTYGEPCIVSDREDIELKIGKFCSIAAGVKILLGVEHRTDWNSTYPFNVLIPSCSYIEGHPASKGDVTIGNDVWLAQGATILSGVTIGDGCVIGANAVVAGSVPPYSIAVGNPAKVIKKRFSDETIVKLQEMRWWDWSYEDIYRVIPLLQSSDIEGLYKYYGEHILKGQAGRKKE